MKVKPNPTIVGLFVMGAMALSVVVLIFLGHSIFRGSNVKFATYFDETVNGLEIGAAVKFRGVKIGQVTGLRIYLDGGGRDMTSKIPVLYEINKARLSEVFGDAAKIGDPEVMARIIERGFRARIAQLSYITGLMYLELDLVDPVEYPPVIYGSPGGYQEIPSMKGPLSEIGDNLTEMINRISSIKFEETVHRLDTLLDTLNEQVILADIPGTTSELKRTASSVSEIMESDELTGLIENASEVMVDVSALANELRAVVDPTAVEFQEAMGQFNTTMQRVEKSSETITAMLRSQSGLRIRLDETLRSIQEASEAFRSWADYMERNPSAFLTGRKDSDD